MLLVDRRGAVVPSTLTESVQVRVLFDRRQRFFELRMRRGRLFAGKAGGLEAVRLGDQGFLTFSSHMDPFEIGGGHRVTSDVLGMCATCHQARESGLESVLSLRQLLKPRVMLDSRHPRWARWFTQATVAAESKSRRADWGLLQGLWQSNPW